LNDCKEKLRKLQFDTPRQDDKTDREIPNLKKPDNNKVVITTVTRSSIGSSKDLQSGTKTPESTKSSKSSDNFSLIK